MQQPEIRLLKTICHILRLYHNITFFFRPSSLFLFFHSLFAAFERHAGYRLTTLINHRRDITLMHFIASDHAFARSLFSLSTLSHPQQPFSITPLFPVSFYAALLSVLRQDGNPIIGVCTCRRQLKSVFVHIIIFANNGNKSNFFLGGGRGCCLQ